MANAQPGTLEKSLIDLETENRQLKAKIEEFEKDFPSQSQVKISNQLTDLKQESDKIADQIKVYAPIAEDVWGLRVFEKAKSYLVAWISLGGITAFIMAIALFVGARQYTVELINGKVQALAEAQVGAIVQKEAEAQVAKYFDEHKQDYTAHVDEATQQAIQQVATAVQSRLGYGGSSGVTKIELPPAVVTTSVVDYTPHMGSVRDGGSEGSVVGFALAYALEYQILKTTGQRIRLSPREIYNSTRKKEHSLDTDSGARISDAIKVLQTDGAVAEEAWPYKAGEFSAQAPKGLETATRYKVKRAYKIVGIDQIKAALSSTGPVVAGITVYDSLHGEKVGKSGLVPMPKPKEQVLGGHAICIVGYDDTQRLFKFINSWGDDWGDHGYGYLPYDYVKDNSADNWALRL